MANSTSTSLVLFQPDDPFDAKTKGAIAAFPAGYSGATLQSHRTDLRIFAEWCTDNRVTVLEAKRAHIEIFGREMESAGKMRSTVARRMSTIAGFFKYCHDERLLDRNPAANVRRPKVDHESRTLGLDRNELGGLLVQAGLGTPRKHTLMFQKGRETWPRAGHFKSGLSVE